MAWLRNINKMRIFIQIILFLTASVNCDNSSEVEPVQHAKFAKSISSRTSQCSERQTNSKKALICSGYPNIPNEPKQENSAVQILDMSSGNNLQTVKKAEFFQANFYNLDTIKLSNNQIRTIERGAFQDLERLKELDLSFNKIDSLDMEMFEKNDALHTLLLNGNPIHQFIGSMFPPLPGLSKIDLSNCKIGSIPELSFSELTNLRELFLHSNLLKRLDWNVFRYSYQLTNIQLQNNPWRCDCHFRFLYEYLSSERKIQFAIKNSDVDSVCSEPELLAGRPWDVNKLHEMNCPPKITKLEPIGSNLIKFIPQDSNDPNSHLVAYSSLGKDISFVCDAEAYPEPGVKWLKNGREIDLNKHGREMTQHDSDNKQHLKIEDKWRTRDGENKYEKYKYGYSTVLSIYRAEPEDMAEYTCEVSRSSVIDSQGIFLNFTNAHWEYDTTTALIMTGGSGGKVWLWIIIGLLLLFILVAVIALGIGIWRRKERRRQKVLKQQMMDKFKDSQTILDDGSLKRNESIKKDDPGAPLLTPVHAHQDIHIQPQSRIPDVAQGKPENIRDLSPDSQLVGQDVFSPRAVDLRRQFFTLPAPGSERPGSAMSIYSNYGYGAQSLQPTNQRVYGILQPNYYHNGRPQSQQQANYPTRRFGSAQSLVHPDPTYMAQRPMLMRQYSGPAYATMRHQHRRPPSVSSMASEPVRPSYVTLPRNFGGLAGSGMDSGFGQSVSPTESNYSGYSSFSYSTLPRRGMQQQRNGVTHDSIGPRTTIDGGSSLSLNKVGVETPKLKMDALDSINSGLLSPTVGKIKAGPGRERLGSSTTPGSLRGGREFFSFEPIQEVEGSIDDVMAQLPPESEVDRLFPKIQIQPTVHEVRYKKKRPPPISAIPPRSRKPIRTFEYSKFGENPNKLAPSSNGSILNQSIAEDPNEINVDGPLPELPASPVPQAPKTSIENIIERVEGTEV